MQIIAVFLGALFKQETLCCMGRTLDKGLDRKLATISVLSALEGVAPQLQFHLAAGMNTELTESQLMQVFSIIEPHIGKQQAEMAKNTLLKITDKKPGYKK